MQHLCVLELGLHQLLRQDDMAEVCHEIGVDAHLDELGLRAQDVNELDAHSLDVERGILAQVKEDLQAIDVQEPTGELTRAGTIVVAPVEQQHLEQLEHLHVEASAGLHREALRNELNLGQDLVTAAGQHVLEDARYRLQILVEVVDGQVPRAPGADPRAGLLLGRELRLADLFLDASLHLQGVGG